MNYTLLWKEGRLVEYSELPMNQLIIVFVQTSHYNLYKQIDSDTSFLPTIRPSQLPLAHLQTNQYLIEKAIPIWMAFIDYHITFDIIEACQILHAMYNPITSSKYTTLFENIYQLNSTKTGKPIKVERGVRQGNIISPKIFTPAMEDIFKQLPW